MQRLIAFAKARKKWLKRGAACVVPLVLLVLMLSQTAFAQITYVITDGDQVVVHTTSASDPAAVLHEAGLRLGEEDTYTTQAGTEGTEITVRRGQIITIDNCGVQLQACSYGETLEELLTRLEVPMGTDYQVSLPLDTETYDGMQVSVEWVAEEEQTYTAEVPFETVYCDAPTLALGEEKVVTEGTAGEALYTDHVTYVNGEESQRENLKTEVTTEPVSRVVLRGTGEDLDGDKNQPIIGNGVIVLPSGEVLTYTHADQYWATAYTSWVEDCTGTTATGTQARVGAIAVDPTVIPYGTRMFIVTNDGEYVYGIATAEDCGGGIKGNHVDLFFNTVEECFQFGVRDCIIYFLGDAEWQGDTDWQE